MGHNELKKQGWERMEKLLDTEMPIKEKRKRALIYYLLGATAVFLILIIYRLDINPLTTNKYETTASVPTAINDHSGGDQKVSAFDNNPKAASSEPMTLPSDSPVQTVNQDDVDTGTLVNVPESNSQGDNGLPLNDKAIQNHKQTDAPIVEEPGWSGHIAMTTNNVEVSAQSDAIAPQDSGADRTDVSNEPFMPADEESREEFVPTLAQKIPAALVTKSTLPAFQHVVIEPANQQTPSALTSYIKVHTGFNTAVRPQEVGLQVHKLLPVRSNLAISGFAGLHYLSISDVRFRTASIKAVERNSNALAAEGNPSEDHTAGVFNSLLQEHRYQSQQFMWNIGLGLEWQMGDNIVLANRVSYAARIGLMQKDEADLSATPALAYSQSNGYFSLSHGLRYQIGQKVFVSLDAKYPISRAFYLEHNGQKYDLKLPGLFWCLGAGYLLN